MVVMWQLLLLLIGSSICVDEQSTRRIFVMAEPQGNTVQDTAKNGTAPDFEDEKSITVQDIA